MAEKDIQELVDKEVKDLVDLAYTRPSQGGGSGTPGKDGKDGKDGTDGKDGKDGTDGKDGKDGYTPVKGTDYYTEEDKAELLAALEGMLPSGGSGGTDWNTKTIVLEEDVSKVVLGGSELLNANEVEIFVSDTIYSGNTTSAKFQLNAYGPGGHIRIVNGNRVAQGGNTYNVFIRLSIGDFFYVGEIASYCIMQATFSNAGERALCYTEIRKCSELYLAFYDNDNARYATGTKIFIRWR